MLDPGTMLAILKCVTAATTTVYNAIEKALKLEAKEQQALKDLHKAIESLKSDTVVYDTLLNAMESDLNPDPNESSAYTRFIQRWVAGL